MIYLKSVKKSIVASLILLALISGAQATEYDGIWFLGFNLQAPPFSDIKAREAVAHCLDLPAVSLGIMSAEAVPAGFIPPGLPGYDPQIAPYKNNIDYARLLMKRAKYRPNDKRLQRLSLLHTDGVKTIEIARRIRDDLKALGMKVELTEVKYSDGARWEKELRSGRHQLFLMGYKSKVEQLFSDQASGEAPGPDSAALLEPLFKTGGPANFSGFSNPTVDMLFDQLSVLGPSLSGEREIKLRDINRALYRELPAIVLFYIEKI